MKSVREIAEEIAAGWSHDEYHAIALSNAIEQALRERDERAVKIIEDHRLQDVCKDNCWTTIKAAISEDVSHDR